MSSWAMASAGGPYKIKLQELGRSELLDRDLLQLAAALAVLVPDEPLPSRNGRGWALWMIP